MFRDDLLEDLGQESLADFEGEYYSKHPTAKKHTDMIRTHTQKKRGFKKK